MPDPLSALRGPSAPSPIAPTPSPSGERRTAFAEHLEPPAEAAEGPVSEAPSPALDALGDAVRSIARGERFVDGAMRRAARGKELEPGQLIAIQAGVYRYTQELELASKLVDKATGAVKQTLQSQQ